ncbi:MAG: DUF2924 domain-containing protein [Pirellula sp.]|nr:DUF2924 domain-containing protein [Pirellula sp.]
MDSLTLRRAIRRRRRLVYNGFEYDGQLFKSLSALANTITGSHLHGLQFFLLGNNS